MVDDWLRALAGRGLPGVRPLPAHPPVAEVLAGASRHKLVGVLAAAVADGDLPLDEHDRSLVAGAHEDAMREVLLLEEELLRAVEVLGAVDVDHRVLKGTALAHMVHDDPAERCFGDNDLLIGGADLDRAVAALVAAGAVRPVPALSPSFDRRFAKSVTLTWSGATELDLHRTLAPGPYGLLVDLDDLFRDPAELLLAGRVARTMPTRLHLLHAAIHVALGDVEPRLGNVRDVALLARRDADDVAAVVETANRWGCAAPVARGLRRTAVLGHDRTPLEQWADRHVISDVDQRRLAAYDVRAGRYRRQARASWSVLGWRDRVAFTWALLRPSATHRAWRRARTSP